MNKILLALLLCCFTCCLPADEIPENDAADTQVELPVSPLRLKGCENNELDLGKVFKLNQRVFTMVIENPSDTPVEYTEIILNCNCTTVLNRKEIKSKGVIPPHGELKFLLRLNGLDLPDKGEFYRYMRLGLKDYQPFVANFTGTVSREIYMTFDDDEKQEPRTRVTIGYINDPEAPWSTTLHILSTLPEDVPLELGEVKATKNFVAALHRFNDHHWSVELHAVTPLSVGELRDGIAITVLSPAKEGEKEVIALPIIGISGAKLSASVYNVFNDPQKDPEVVTKKFALSREPFIDKFALAAMVVGRANPYHARIKALEVDEVSFEPVKGVSLRLEQGRGGVYVYATMNRAEMTEEGVEVEFKSKNNQSEFVRFAILGEKERAELEEERAEKERIAAEEAAAQAEQEEMQREALEQSQKAGEEGRQHQHQHQHQEQE